MKKENNKSMQEWLPFDYLLKNGIIKKKDNNYIKIIKVIPINYNLKSDLEKQAILNSYKTFLKTQKSTFQKLSKKQNKKMI